MNMAVERWKSQLVRLAELDVLSDICNDHLRTMLFREHHRLKAPWGGRFVSLRQTA